MKKRIQKCIEAGDYVKVSLAEKNGDFIMNVDGIILDQSPSLILMSDSFDFHYDGLVVVQKKDISEVRLTDNERFMKKILASEGYSGHVKKRFGALKLKLTTLKSALQQAQRTKLPIIIECKYGEDDVFQIGPIVEVTDKRVKVNHFNSRGEFDTKPAGSKLKDITLVKIDCPYANTFYKYAKRVD